MMCIMYKCKHCGRTVTEDTRDRGCVWHSVDRQIKELFPFLTLTSKGNIKLKGDDIVKYEMTWIRDEDKK